MKTTPLTRRTPLPRVNGSLRRAAKLARRAPLAQARPKPAVSTKVRRPLAVRSGGSCEARLAGCWGRATDACHRIALKAGGRPVGHHRLSNLWHGCRWCHRWATHNPSAAYDLGLALREHQDPATTPMAYRAGLVLLGDDGTVTPTDQMER